MQATLRIIIVAVIVSLSAVAAHAQSCPSPYSPGVLITSSRNATTGTLAVQADPYDLDSINASYIKAVNQYGTIIAQIQTNTPAILNFNMPRGTGTVTVYVGNMNRCNGFVSWVYGATITN